MEAEKAEKINKIIKELFKKY